MNMDMQNIAMCVVVDIEGWKLEIGKEEKRK